MKYTLLLLCATWIHFAAFSCAFVKDWLTENCFWINDSEIVSVVEFNFLSDHNPSKSSPQSFTRVNGLWNIQCYFYVQLEFIWQSSAVQLLTINWLKIAMAWMDLAIVLMCFIILLKFIPLQWFSWYTLFVVRHLVFSPYIVKMHR